MKVSYLTSGFKNGFTDLFINDLMQYLKTNPTFAFIASDFTIPSINDRYFKHFLLMFKEKGISFDSVYVIDNRINEDEAKYIINNADVVWIAGGDTLKQIDYIKSYNLIPNLQSREGITIGMSAGSINMATNVVLAKDEEDNIPKLSLYDGIGLVHINVEPHLDLSRNEHIEDIKEASKHGKIYGLYDDSFICCINDKIEIFGEYEEF